MNCRIGGYKTPLLIKTPLDTFWPHTGHFRKISFKITLFLDENLGKMIIVSSSKMLRINRTPAFYIHQYGIIKLNYWGLHFEKHWSNPKNDLVDPHRTKNGQNAPSWTVEKQSQIYLPSFFFLYSDSILLKIPYLLGFYSFCLRKKGNLIPTGNASSPGD